MEENNQVPQQPQAYAPPPPGAHPQKPKKPIFKKWWFWVLIVLAVVIIISKATSGGDGPTEPQTDAGGQTVAAAGTAANNDIMQGSGALGKYSVAIGDARKGIDWSKDNILIVTYTWTNNGDSATSFAFAFSDKAYQDGIECEKVFGSDDFDSKSSNDIKPGATLTLEVGYKLNDTTSTVDIEIGEFISFSSKKVVKTFALN